MKELFITSSVLIAAVIALRFIFGNKISRRVRYALWLPVLVRLMLPFSLGESSLSVMNAVESASAAGVYEDFQAPTVTPAPAAPLPEASAPSSDSGDTDGITGAKSLPPETLIKSVWLGGSAAVGLWLLGANLVFYLRLRKGRRPYSTSCPLPVYVTEGLASPCLFGLIRPAIYLTPGAAENPEAARFVLTHELYHYRHGDHLWSVLRGLCLAAYWFNPFVWAAAIFSREDSELACDEAVLSRLGRDSRLAYGRTLVDMVALGRTQTGVSIAATTMVSGRRELQKRLETIIRGSKNLLPALAAVILTAVLCVGCTFTGARSLTPAQALDALASSVTFTQDGQVSFEIPADYKTPKDWHIHIAGREVYEDGFSRSVHLFEDIDDAKTWEPGKAYTISLSDAYTELTLTATLPDKRGAVLEKSVDLLTGEIVSDTAQVLFELRNPYIGDAAADMALLQALGLEKEVGQYDIELETDKAPYVLRIVFTDTITNLDALQSVMSRDSLLLLALIENASKIEWHYRYEVEATGESGVMVGGLSLEDANAALNGDVKIYGQSSEGIAALLSRYQSSPGPREYTLSSLGPGGETLSQARLTEADEIALAEAVIENYMVKSAAWKGGDLGALDTCCLLEVSYGGADAPSAYYAYLLDGKAVMQLGAEGYYSRIDDALYEALLQLTSKEG